MEEIEGLDKMMLKYAALLLVFMAIMPSVHAYYNITAINTTVTLYKNTSAHVIETFNLFVSNSSMQQYLTNRDAVGLSLSDWQKTLYTTQLTEHIINSRHSSYGFTFLPGPLITSFQNGEALLTMSYYVNNVTMIKNIAPRKFEYAFNSSVFNFENTASGQTLPDNVRLNILLPQGAQAISMYPLPDYPPPTYLGNYGNFTDFSWYSGEPLAQFSFYFVETQGLQQEVLDYFSGLYSSYRALFYVVAVAIVVLVIAYSYLRAGRRQEGE